MDQGGNYWTLFPPRIWKLLHAVFHVAAEFGRHGAVHRHVPGLPELRLPDGQDPLIQVDIAAAKVQGLGNAQPGRCDQSEDRLVSHRLRGAVRGQLPGRGEEVADLLIGTGVPRSNPRKF